MSLHSRLICGGGLGRLFLVVLVQSYHYVIDSPALSRNDVKEEHL